MNAVEQPVKPDYYKAGYYQSPEKRIKALQDRVEQLEARLKELEKGTGKAGPIRPIWDHF